MKNLEISTDGGRTFSKIEKGEVVFRVRDIAEDVGRTHIEVVGTLKTTAVEVQDDPYADPQVIRF